ncbi:MAG: hypothetical protein H7177_09735 [Rhizobacter sp.]|nr:hypothetical protein [Bacteriovorax sp.]
MKIFGKIIYKIFYYTFTFVLSIFLNSKVKTWYRNSICEDYFSFGKSDLDLTVFFNDDDHLLAKINSTKKVASFFLIIKEINYYYPFSLDRSLNLINSLELQRDPGLVIKLSKKVSVSENEKIVYFLRIFFSIQTDLQKKLNHREVKKWNYHLKKIFPVDEFVITVENNSTDVLTGVMQRKFSEDSLVFISDIVMLYQVIREKTDLYLYFDKNTTNKNFYLIFFPHLFCYQDMTFNSVTEFQIKIFLDQVKWEIWAMMSQPWIFNDSSGFAHLTNLRNAIERSQIPAGKLKNDSNVLINTIDDYIVFLLDQTKKII